MDKYAEAARKIVSNGLFPVAVALMDDELREAVHAELAPCSEADFLAEYMHRHGEKYGEDFDII